MYVYPDSGAGKTQWEKPTIPPAPAATGTSCVLKFPTRCYGKMDLFERPERCDNFYIECLPCLRSTFARLLVPIFFCALFYFYLLPSLFWIRLILPVTVLPAGWTEHVDPATGRKFYYQKSTGATTWTAPPPAPGTPGALPAGWTEHFDAPRGKPFYFHQATGKTQWEKPDAAAAPAAKAAAAAPAAKAAAAPAAAAKAGKEEKPKKDDKKDAKAGKEEKPKKDDKKAGKEEKPKKDDKKAGKEEKPKKK